MIFVDTSGWYAAAVPSDPHHAAVTQWLRGNSRPLVTTDYVIDELLTLMRSRGERTRAIRSGEQLLELRFARIIYVGQKDVRRAWDIYKSWHDKDWSFTDCASRAVMERLPIDAAVSTDQHFRQFGTVTVVP